MLSPARSGMTDFVADGGKTGNLPPMTAKTLAWPSSTSLPIWRLRLSGTTMLVCRYQAQDFSCILFHTLLILLQRPLESFKL